MDCSATFRNTRSKLGLGSSALTSRAMSMKRLDCSGSSGSGFGLRGMVHCKHVMKDIMKLPFQANRHHLKSSEGIVYKSIPPVTFFSGPCHSGPQGVVFPAPGGAKLRLSLLRLVASLRRSIRFLGSKERESDRR